MQALKGDVDPIVHEPKRLAILAALMSGPLTFSELREAVELTDGNLDSHLRKLGEAGYTTKQVRKNGLVRRRRETIYGVSGKGRRAFDDYLAAMERKVAEARRAAG